MFYNGALVSSNATGTWFTGASKTFQMFRGDYYGGGPEMGELIIFPRALTSEQISSIYTSQLSKPIPATTLTGTPLFSQLSSAATSSAVGAFSLRAVNGTSARAVQVRPQAQFPATGFTSAVTNPGGNQYNQTLTGYAFGGAGAYTSNCSSWAPDQNTPTPWKAFDNNTNTWWENNYGVESGYNGIGATSANTYSGSYTTTVSGSSVGGEWLQLGFPTAIVLYSYSMYNRFGYNGYRMPYAWTVAGSNDGTTWATVDSQTGIIWTSATQTFTTTSTTTYLYFRLIVRAIQSNGNTGQPVNIGQWTLNGSNASWNTDFYADRLGNLLTAPVTGQPLANWLGGATGYVTTWYDQSGKGNHATQTTAANQPKIDLTNKQIDFKPSAYFDLPNGTVPLLKAYTVISKHNTIQNTANGGIVGGGPRGTNNITNRFRRSYTAYQNYWWGNDIYIGTYADGNVMTWKFTAETSSSAGTTYVYQNSSLVNSAYRSGWAATTPGNETIGTTDGSYGELLNGELYYVFLFGSALSDTDRTLVEALPI
jgi:hypothetical protein